MPPSLPPHLSYKTAIVLLPPPAVTPPIEAIRRVHDAHFARWPPHVNLIYPFLASPSTELSSNQQAEKAALRTLKPDIQTRIKQVTEAITPFHALLTAEPRGIFHHSKRGKTVWLDPSTSSESLKFLQAALQAEFLECDADKRPFTPHLSVGQAKTEEGVQNLSNQIKQSILEHISTQVDGEEHNSISLDWHVESVFVIERKGYHDRFKVIGTVKLGQ